MLNFIEFNSSVEELKKHEKTLVGLLIVFSQEIEGMSIISTLLIGHINDVGGACDCCDQLANETLRILKYVRVYMPEVEIKNYFHDYNF